MDVEVCSRCAIFLFKYFFEYLKLYFRIHYNFLINRVPIEEIKSTIQSRINELRVNFLKFYNDIRILLDLMRLL